MKMKKTTLMMILFCVLILIAIIVGMTSFGKPSSLDDKTYDATKKIIGYVDDYLDMRISNENLRNKINDLSEDIAKGDSDEERRIRISITILCTDLLSDAPSSIILESRNKLAKEIGEKKRK